ncbi:DUF484 family protein [Roseateles depolymerans]|uniref:Uncharacterized protein n=1 Tax=Roseateles depolymerans TaxID=76731 RepID=A0A0U3M9B3_9BURK|nr:DUF484 family protein [Roseateles depolymerans]ALV05165.1 hypothetical protein RD2015_669 [Roseateles depolymerans]REG14819.1 hypothetical protein DES44_3316 [Roseateles depolymerans]
MSGIEGITEQDIADYLARDPGFFERHAELLATVRISHPHGQRAVSLQERQAELLRDKIRGLEHKIVEMIRNGQENVAIADRLHRWTLALMLTREDGQLPEVLLRELRHQFLIPQANLRLWNVNAGHALAPFASEVSSDVKTFVSSLNQPYCGINSGFEAARWLEEDVASLALVPLMAGTPSQPFGLLVLGSPDPTRYTAEMGTEFLTRVGEIASAALSRLLTADPHAAAQAD